MEISITDPIWKTALENELGHPAPYNTTELAQIQHLSLSHIRDLSPLIHCIGLKSLQLTGIETESLHSVGSLKGLVVLSVFYSPVRDISPLAGCDRLTHLILDCCFIEDITPLLSLRELSDVSLRGNPLSVKSYRETAAAISAKPGQSTGQLPIVSLSPEDEWDLTLKLHEKGIKASYSRGRLSAPGLGFVDNPEENQVTLTPEELRAELEKPNLSLHSLWGKQVPEAPVERKPENIFADYGEPQFVPPRPMPRPVSRPTATSAPAKKPAATKKPVPAKTTPKKPAAQKPAAAAK